MRQMRKAGRVSGRLPEGNGPEAGR
jgi:hypothetical protein